MALVTERLPQEFDITDSAGRWPLIGAGLLARMTSTLARVLDLQEERIEADASILTRSLYEHAVHFAWLAADPSPGRIDLWWKDDRARRLKADDDTTAHGMPMLTPANRKALQEQVASVGGVVPLVLADLAIAADKHWAGKLRGMGKHTEAISFRGMYALLYRSYSFMAHPSETGLQRVAEDLAPGRVRIQLERPSARSGPWGMATVVYTAALMAASASLGWPDDREIHAIYERTA